MINSKIGKTLSSFFITAVTGAVLLPGMSVFADSSVVIDKTNFPDENFRKFVSKSFDTDKNGNLSSSEIKAVDEITCGVEEIKSLKGIEFFTDVELIYCVGNELSELDLSNNTKLKRLFCYDNRLMELDLSGNPELTQLACANNRLTSLDLEKNTKLDDLNCAENELGKLDVSKNTSLTAINCRKCGLEALDLSKNVKLEYVDCMDNAIKELDLTQNAKLNTLYANSNKLTSIDLSGLTKLYIVWLEDNQLKTLDIEDWKEIADLHLDGNKIDYLDISKCKRLIKAFTEGDETVGKGCSIYNINAGAQLIVDQKTMIATESVELSGEKTASLKLPCCACAKVYVKGAAGSADISWSSSDSSAVTVDKNGVVKAVKGGSATITASVDGKEYKCSVRSLYKDVKDPSKFWYEPAYYLTDKGIVKGYNDQTRFKPANKCTRAQMVTFLWRLAGSPEPETKECKFSDVDKSDYFYKACLWGNEKGIVEGYKDGTFGPQIVCARRHAVTFLWRLAGKPEPAGDKTKFTDVFKDIDEKDYFFKATIWATEQKIVAGYDDNTFRPDGDCLRRQMVTFLYKYDKFVNNKR
ncbi:MAG: S-layer homology domain-containing protein [Clostridiales bacterium]|nr:S-layer homology domain-containing protein [Clostridiales bacterium]